MMAPGEFQFVSTPSDKTQHALMIEDFVALAQSGSQGEFYEARISSSERTQQLLDAILDNVA
ncbi:MAG: hypothetical protein AB4040_17635 [Synechococcus sp.]